MAAVLENTTKRLAISKANAQMVAVVGVASFVTIFCLIASQAVWGQNKYQARLTTEKEKAHRQLQANLKAFDSLVASYKKFDGTGTNVIGGNKSGTGDNDGPNSKIILDALPSTYDFPALTSSLEKLMTDRGLKPSTLSGSDDQINQQSNATSSKPQTVTMPFTLGVTNANYQAVQQFIGALQQSIRPMPIDTLDLSGGADSMTATVSAHTYYQPGKTVNITQKVVK